MGIEKFFEGLTEIIISPLEKLDDVINSPLSDLSSLDEPLDKSLGSENGQNYSKVFSMDENTQKSDLNDNPFVVKDLDLWYNNLGIDFDDPNRLEYLKLYANPYMVEGNGQEILARSAYDKNGTLDISGWAVSNNISLDDPLLFEKFKANGDHVKSEMSQDFLQGAMDYAKLEAKFDKSGANVPISAKSTGMLEDMHLNAMERAENAKESGDYRMANKLKNHAMEIDNIMHGNNGNW